MAKNTTKFDLKGKGGKFRDDDLSEKFIITNSIEVSFRPVTANDNQLWTEFINKCSKDSLYSRFQTTSSVIKNQGDLYCHTDYENTITIGVFIVSNREVELIGSAWLIRDNETNEVELALLIADNWQHRGIGTKLSELCRNIILKWGVDAVKGTTTLGNFEIKKLLSKNNIAFKNSFEDNSLEFTVFREEIAS